MFRYIQQVKLDCFVEVSRAILVSYLLSSSDVILFWLYDLILLGYMWCSCCSRLCLVLHLDAVWLCWYSSV